MINKIIIDYFIIYYLPLTLGGGGKEEERAPDDMCVFCNPKKLATLIIFLSSKFRITSSSLFREVFGVGRGSSNIFQIHIVVANYCSSENKLLTE